MSPYVHILETLPIKLSSLFIIIGEILALSIVCLQAHYMFILYAIQYKVPITDNTTIFYIYENENDFSYVWKLKWWFIRSAIWLRHPLFSFCNNTLIQSPFSMQSGMDSIVVFHAELTSLFWKAEWNLYKTDFYYFIKL